MIEFIVNTLRVVLFIGVIACIGYLAVQEDKRAEPPNTITTTDTIAPLPCFYDKLASEGLYEALEFHGIHHPEIVYAQAVLETGHFKSSLCWNKNNLFGLYNSDREEYHEFEHWAESVIAYKEWVQKRYRPPENYYSFLKRIRYASDPQYIIKLKQIVKQENDKRRYAERDTLSQRV